MKLLALVIMSTVFTACTSAPPEQNSQATGFQEPVRKPTYTSTQLPTEPRPPTLTPTEHLTSTPESSPALTPIPASPIHLVTADDGLVAGEIRNLWIDASGHLWVASETGIFIHLDNNWNKLYDGPIERLLGADKDQRIWAILNGETAIAAYDHSEGWSIYGPMQGWTVPPPVEYLSPGYSDGIVTDTEGQVWLATGRDDLRRFDPQSQSWEIFNALDIGFEPVEDEGYQGHFLTDVEQSLNQKVWVGDCIGVGEGLKGQGIRWSNEGSWFDAPFTHGECVQDIEIDSLGRMWVGGFDAILQYDPSGAEWTRIPLPHYERRQLVTDITLDKKDNPWIEILRFGGASPFGTVARIHLEDGEWVSDFDGWFSSLALGEDGVAWLCSEGLVQRLENGEGEEVGTVPGNQCQIVVDGTGRIWVTNTSDLWWIDPP